VVRLVRGMATTLFFVARLDLEEMRHAPTPVQLHLALVRAPRLV
jgi:hypothetical protein